jgi:hypothetical protein
VLRKHIYSVPEVFDSYLRLLIAGRKIIEQLIKTTDRIIYVIVAMECALKGNNDNYHSCQLFGLKSGTGSHTPKPRPY